MKISSLRIDGQTFFLNPEQSIPDLKEDIVSAARDGAGFVEFNAVGHGLVSVLITPTESARFETVDRPDQETGGWQSDLPPFDVERYSS